MPAANSSSDVASLGVHNSNFLIPCHTIGDPKSSHDTWNWPDWMHAAYTKGDSEFIQTTKTRQIMIQVLSARKDLIEDLLQVSTPTGKPSESRPKHERATTDTDTGVAGLLTQ